METSLQHHSHSHEQSLFERVKPFVGVVALQLAYAIMDILSKAAMNKGTSNYVFVFYRNAVAVVVIAPIAWFLDKKVRPKMTWTIFWKIAALSLLEPIIDQNSYYLGVKYTTATFVAAISNISPAMTFIMAYFLRIEKIQIKSIRSQAKVVGTITTVLGAMIMTLMKGPLLLGSHKGSDHDHHNNGTSTQHTIIGALMITLGCFCMSSFVILQGNTLKTYPAELSLSAWIGLLGTIENAAIALVMEKGNLSAWSLKWDMSLICLIYTGIVCSGVGYYLQGIVVQARGPVFVTAFNPLSMIMVAILGFFLLAEQVLLGMLIGAIVICVGLYAVVWGKSKDYNPPKPTLPAELIEEEDNAKKEHSTLRDEDNAKENSTREIITNRVELV